MERFKNILLFVQSQTWAQEACQRAITLAAEENARLTILDVSEPKQLLNTEIPDRCEKLKEQLLFEHGKLQIEICAVRGNPFVEVMRQIMRGRHDLVMIAPRSKASARQSSPERIVLQMIHKCPCPVWVISPVSPNRKMRIMAAVDPDQFDARRNALNTKILDRAASLAAREGTELRVVNAWRAPAERVLRGHAGLMAEDVNRYVVDVLIAQRKLVDDLVEDSKAKTLNHRVHLMKGEATATIPVLARRERTDLLIVGTFSRRGISRWLIGNTAEKLLKIVNCSLLIIKPDGMVRSKETSVGFRQKKQATVDNPLFATKERSSGLGIE